MQTSRAVALQMVAGLLIFPLLGSVVGAEEVQISALTNQELEETSAISGTCQKEKLHMRCQMSQVMVRRRLDPAKAEEEKQKRFEEAKKT